MQQDFSKFFGSFKQKVSSIKEQVSEQLPQLQEQINQRLAPWVPSLGGAAGGGGEEVEVGGRRLRVVKKLGEGGYSFVYLAREVHTPSAAGGSALPGQLFALKKVLAGAAEQLAEARHEIDVMRRMRHPNLLPLLDYAVVATNQGGGAGASHIVYMLFPLYASNLWDAVQARLQAGSPLSPREVAYVFLRLCSALEAMHASPPALAHRDVKPHNILLRPTQPGGLAGLGSSNTGGPLDGAHFTAAAAPLAAAQPAAAEGAALPELQRCEVVLMDFGSAAAARLEVTSRGQAVAVQEDAERLCTAPYRAPELWDVPSSCALDERVDVWAAGCVLYFLMVGESPFERAANEAGGSLMLAVVNGRYTWPEAAQRRYPPALQELAASCLTLDAAARPFVAGIKARAEALAAEM